MKRLFITTVLGLACCAAAYARCTSNNLTTNLVVDGTTAVGSVTVANDFTNLYITVATTGTTTIDHLDVAASLTLAGIPQTGNQAPEVQNFPYQESFSPAVTTYTFTIPLGVAVAGTSMYIAVHADVTTPSSGSQGASHRDAAARIQGGDDGHGGDNGGDDGHGNGGNSGGDDGHGSGGGDGHGGSGGGQSNTQDAWGAGQLFSGAQSCTAQGGGGNSGGHDGGGWGGNGGWSTGPGTNVSVSSLTNSGLSQTSGFGANDHGDCGGGQGGGGQGGGGNGGGQGDNGGCGASYFVYTVNCATILE